VTTSSVALLALAALDNSTKMELIVFVFHHLRWSRQAVFVAVTCDLARGVAEKFSNVNEPLSVALTIIPISIEGEVGIKVKTVDVPKET